LIVKNIDARFTISGGCELILAMPKSERESISHLIEEFVGKEDKEWECSVGLKKKKRSLDANAYLWVLADKIAAKLNTTKELVYQEAIKQVGVFDTLLLQDKAVDNFVSLWNGQGLGNYAEVMYQSKTVKNCTAVRAYHGSHLYDTVQMSRLVDYIVSEAKEQGIETMTPDELERMKTLWGKEKE
jgi:hypothetical protein